ncbi:hypothetical protein FACS1894167_15200 [Synergistales bacterium]|nr:hypothetical protein FACS1894167_15200 [Synergistales bacterium]
MLTSVSIATPSRTRGLSGAASRMYIYAAYPIAYRRRNNRVLLKDIARIKTARPLAPRPARGRYPLDPI